MKNSKRKISVAESFYSIQGEGFTTGVPAVFLRLAGCNLMCGGQGTQTDKKLHNGATWRCDTIEVWMKGKSKQVDQILSDKEKRALIDGAHLVITGGEPLMQQKGICALIDHVRTFAPDCYIEIETNGTIVPLPELQKLQFNCSPKLSNSGMTKEQCIKPDALDFFKRAFTQFKFVISSEEDWREVLNDYVPHIGTQKIVLMPAGENQNELNTTRPIVAEICKRERIKMTDRLHITIWNQKTGV